MNSQKQSAKTTSYTFNTKDESLWMNEKDKRNRIVGRAGNSLATTIFDDI